METTGSVKGFGSLGVIGFGLVIHVQGWCRALGVGLCLVFGGLGVGGFVYCFLSGGWGSLVGVGLRLSSFGLFAQ